MIDYDAIIVGGGHNGLTAAAYLARAGRRVLVLETRDVLGGYCTTEENVPEAPGFRMNPCALDCLMTSIPRSVIDELQLSRHGLRLVEPAPWGSYIGPDGESIGLWRDRARTVREIARLSPADATRFERFCAIMRDFWWAAAPYLQDHPTRPRPRTLAELLWRTIKGRRSIRPMARLLLSSPEQILEEWFEREEVKAFLANLAIVSYLPLQEPGSGAVLGATSLYIEWGAQRPVGGSGAFTAAIASCAASHGAQIRSGAHAEEIIVDDSGAVRGVRLHGGEELFSRQVVGAVDPRKLLSELVPAEHVPSEVRRELRGLGVLRWNISTFKADVALRTRTPLACGRQELWNGFLLLGDTIEYIRRAQRDCISGTIPQGLPMWVAMPSVVDPSQVPPGSGGETLYVYTCTVPTKLADGSSWKEHREPVRQRCMEIIEDYAPGISQTVIGAHVKTPDDYAQLSSSGHVIHADVSISQMGPWRPTPSLAGYRTPVDGLWHAGAGAHPIGLLNGWSGRTVARQVDRRLAREPAHPARPSAGRGAPATPLSVPGDLSAREEMPIGA